MKKFANGSGSIVKYKARKKYYVFAPAKRTFDTETLKTKSARKTLGTFPLTKEGYQDALALLIDYNRNPSIYNARSITLSQLFELWKKEDFSKIALSTQKATLSIWKNGCADIANVTIGDIKRPQLQLLVDECVVPTMKTGLANLLNKLFNYALINGFIRDNPAMSLSARNEGYTPQIKRSVFTVEEVNKLWGLFHSEESDIVAITLIMLYTGMRRAELVTVRKASINFAERYMLGGVKTKAGKNRIIPLNTDILPLIKSLYDRSDEYLLDYMKFDANNFISSHFVRLMNRLELSHTPHDCRYTFVSRMYELNAPDLLVKRIIGHSANDLTKDLYTKIDIVRLVEVVDILHYKSVSNALATQQKTIPLHA